MAFSPVPDSRAEACLIDRYYGGLIRILRRMRALNTSMVLSPVDIANLDFGRPVRLRRVQVGELVLSDGYYVLNKLSDYEDGYPTKVALLAF